MLTCLTWKSEEIGATLTPQEVDVLFNFTYQLADIGQLSNGNYVGASRPLYWQRVKGEN